MMSGGEGRRGGCVTGACGKEYGDVDVLSSDDRKRNYCELRAVLKSNRDFVTLVR